jgi:hypothetical protein
MMRWMRQTLALAMVATMVLSLTMASMTALPGHARAQASDDDSDSFDSGQAGDDDSFTSGGGTDDGFGPTNRQSDTGDQDQTDNKQYVDEGTPGGSVNLNFRQTQARIGQEQSQFPRNLGWGAATGLLIGGWLALLNAGDNRSNLRSLGTGVVLGAGLGVLIGMRTVIDPNAPVPSSASNAAPASGPTSLTLPLVAFDNHDHVIVGFVTTF